MQAELPVYSGGYRLESSILINPSLQRKHGLGTQGGKGKRDTTAYRTCFADLREVFLNIFESGVLRGLGF